MPLTKKGKKIMRSMKSQYGSKKGTSVFYASRNKGKISGVEENKIMNWKNRRRYRGSEKVHEDTLSLGWEDKILTEMCKHCHDEGMAAAEAEEGRPGKKQHAYNKARRKAEHRRHGRKGETPRGTQTRRHGRGGVPSARLTPAEQRALAQREEEPEEK